MSHLDRRAFVASAAALGVTAAWARSTTDTSLTQSPSPRPE